MEKHNLIIVVTILFGSIITFQALQLAQESGGEAKVEYPPAPEDAVRIAIYRAVIHDMYNRCSFTRGRKVPIFISPIYRISKHYGDMPLLWGLLKAHEDLPTKRVSFARREEVVGTMSPGGTVRGGGAFITVEATGFLNVNLVVVETWIYYGNLGAEGFRYTLANIDGSWEIMEAKLTWIS